jgi:hypothetical protein
MRSRARRPGGRLRSFRASGVPAVLVPVTLALSACGGSSSPQSAGTTSSSSSTTGAGTGASSSTTPTSAASGTTVATLAVVACPTTYAIAVTTTTTLPGSVSVSVPAAAAGNLVVYGDDDGIMMMVGPKGWTCHAAYGADGSGGLLISPAGESVPSDPDGGWHLTASSMAQAIVAYEVGASTVQAAGLACPLFSAAAAVYQQTFGHACAPRPVAETVAGTGSTEAGFEDPAGVAGDGMPSGGTNPANGVMLYLPGGTDRSAGYLATCTLPVAQHDVCTAVLNHFVLLYG